MFLFLQEVIYTQILLLFYDQHYHHQPPLQCHVLQYQDNLLHLQVHRPVQQDPLLLIAKDGFHNNFLSNIFFLALSNFFYKIYIQNNSIRINEKLCNPCFCVLLHHAIINCTMIYIIHLLSPKCHDI